MLSIKTWNCAKNASAYYVHESKIEYYASEEVGLWRGGEQLGITTGERVEQEQLENILNGLHPNSRKPILSVHGDKHRPGYDLTFSPPKSVSAFWAMAPNSKVRDEILTAHHIAVDKALDHLDKYAAITRRGKGGTKREKVQNLISAKFTHSTSRENDPQLHTHCLIANLAQRQDNTWGTIESKYIYEEQMAIGAVYRSELAHQLQKSLGVEIEKKEKSFEISGVSKEIIENFSTRRKQIKEKAKESGFNSPKAMDFATLNTRKEKKVLDVPKLRKEWQQKGHKLGFHTLDVINQKEYKLESPSLNSITEALSLLTESKSTFEEREIRQAIATNAQGVYGSKEIDKAISMMKDHPDIVYLGRSQTGHERYTSKDIYQIERSMYDKAIEQSKSKDYQISKVIVDQTLDKHPDLRNEQRKMVQSLTQEPGQVKIALGGAGSGKSYAMGTACEIWKGSGFKIYGLAPTGTAARKLEESTKVKSTTVDRFLHHHEEISNKTILMVDEAGMMGSIKLNKLLEEAYEYGAKVVLVGDPKQLQPIEAGAPTRMLREGVGYNELETMQRQSVEWQQSATKFFSQGKAKEALEMYQKGGQLKTHANYESLTESITKDYINHVKDHPEKSRIIISETNQNVRAINESVRNELKKESLIKNYGYTVNIKNRKDELEKREIIPGERIYFTKNNQKMGVTNGTFGKVLSIEKEKKTYHINVLTDQGQKVLFSTDKYKHIEYGYAVTVHKSQGDTLDKTFYAVSERSGRESSYVAMSRHRENATLYIDSSSFSQKIEPHQQLTKEEFKKYIQEKTIEKSAKVMSKQQEKENTLDYKINDERPLLITKNIKEMAESLLHETDTAKKVNLLHKISTAHLGSESPIKSPVLEQAEFQIESTKILKFGLEKDYLHTNNLARDILSLKIGYDIDPSYEMREYKQKIDKEFEPVAKQAIERNRLHQKRELTQDFGMSL